MDFKVEHWNPFKSFYFETISFFFCLSFFFLLLKKRGGDIPPPVSPALVLQCLVTCEGHCIIL